MNRGVFPAFSRLWKEKTGEVVFFPSSFAGSGTITNQVLLGAPAAVVLLAHEGDALRLKAAGIARTDWREFPARGVVNRTPFVILVRKGIRSTSAPSPTWAGRECRNHPSGSP